MKKGWIALLTLFIAASLGGCESFAASETAQAAALAEGQSEVYGKVVAATGNDITLALGELEKAATEEREDADEPSAGADESASSRSGRGGARSGGAAGGAPAGFPAEMGDIPSGMGEFPDGMDGASGRGRAARQSLALTGEESTYRIPVGTPVTVASGESALTTSFMRIDVDNVVRLVLQDIGGEQVVVAAQIIS